MRELKRSRMNESAYNSALNEVRHDVEHEFKSIELTGNWYIGLDNVKYDYDELSATLFVLNDKDEVVDEETITIPIDAMKDYTTVEIASLKDRMLEKINEVAENLKDSWDVGRGYYESKGKRSRNESLDNVSLYDTLCDDHFDNCSRLKKLSGDYPVSIYSYKNDPHLLIIVSKLSYSEVAIQELRAGRDDIYTETFDENFTSEFEKAISWAKDLCK